MTRFHLPIFLQTPCVWSFFYDSCSMDEMEKPEEHTEQNTWSDELAKLSAGEREVAILKFWKERSIFEKSLKQNEGKDPYVFYDGPPFATGLPHQGHILQGTIKDLIPRFQTMRGRYVRREWGWDCHGLPLENIIEKELGLKKKQDILEYGIENFNQKAREAVLRYETEWKAIVPRTGRWVDMDMPYKTMDPSYTESIWWAFKKLHTKKLIYEGYKSMHICPRCETTLAASEVALGYKDVKDISVYVKFELTDEPDTSLVAWTTTPWTLPGNVAIAVNPDIDYVKVRLVRKENPSHLAPEYIYLAKDRLTSVMEKFGKEYDYEVVDTVKGKELVGKSYTPVFDYYSSNENLENRERGWKVYAADFVTANDGTGIAHEAPAFGEVDMELGKKMKLPFIQHVGMDGKIKPEVTDFAGLYVKPKSDDDKERLATDIAVLKYLQEHGHFFAKENITHSYPHCWRCDWPLLNYAASSWFVDVTTLKPRLIEENKEIKWVPEGMRDGRFGKWLEGARDWAISRSRFWGAPLPVWKCNKCGLVESFGSIEELKAKSRSTNSYMVMRHGESETNVRGILSYKPEDVYPLTEAGRKRAESSAKKLAGKGVDLIIASPVMRTKETAEIVRKALGLSAEQLITDDRLGEVRTGEFSGCSIETYREYFTSTLEKFSKPSPGGETLEEMKNRLAEFLYETDKKYQGKKILFVTHEYGTWLLEAVAKGATNEEASMMRVLANDDYIDYAEVRDFAFAPIPHNHKYELDFHRPYIDDMTYQCSCHMGEMVRIPDVFDCWFESGSMSFAQFHYMGDETTPEGKLFAKNFPADFIAEGVDQTRGWFYTLLILSVALFDRAAMKSVITTGIILAEDGQKMSKKLKNYDDPMELAAKFGADAIRFYMINSPVVRGEELQFTSLGVDEVFKKMTLRIGNVLQFYSTYAGNMVITREPVGSTDVLDKWIVARWNEMHAEVTHYIDNHELDRATRLILPFVDDLSTWYIRRSRDRFHSDNEADRMAAKETTGWVLLELAKLLAPFMPFLAEYVYQSLSIENKKESVHLESWPPIGISLQRILEEMTELRRIVTLALEARAKAGIKVRQPLATLTIGADQFKDKADYLAIIADEVNVKKVEIVKGTEGVTLDTMITEELKIEGEVRDLIREIQDLRKKAGLNTDDRIAVTLPTSAAALIEKFGEEIKLTVGATSLTEGTELSVKKT